MKITKKGGRYVVMEDLDSQNDTEIELEEVANLDGAVPLHGQLDSGLNFMESSQELQEMTQVLDQNKHGNTETNDLDIVSPELVVLEEPDYDGIWNDRAARTRASMRAASAHLTKRMFPQECISSSRDKAAIKIQANYRGFKGRMVYEERLYQKFLQEEKMRKEKIQQQVEEGELLVENHRLEVLLEDNITARRNSSRRLISHIITIQRAWRLYRECKIRSSNNSGCSSVTQADQPNRVEVGKDFIADTKDQSCVNSTSDRTAEKMSGFTSPVEEFLRFKALGAKKFNPMETSTISTFSDYSEMAEPLKEHLANVQIISTTEPETNGTIYNSPFTIGQKISRSPEETDEQYSKRLKKINYLSLAQEFAELKKIDADALPFNLHKEGQDDSSPMSEASLSSGTESDRCLTESEATTPVDMTDGIVNEANLIENHIGKLTSDLQSLNTDDATVAPPRTDQENKTEAENIMNHNKQTDSKLVQNAKDVKPPTQSHNGSANSKESSSSNNLKPSRPLQDDSEADSHGQPDGKSPKKKLSLTSPGSDKLEDFDVYNIESTLPQMDWAMLEEQLQKAAEEEKRKRESRRNDREEIRRKLAMAPAPEEEYYPGYKRPNLQSRLQSGMNLQICFMNEASSDQENGDHDKTTPPRTDNKREAKDEKQDDGMKVLAAGLIKEAAEDDFFIKQARLQDEARMALAQVRPMAHMQLEIEKQLRKKSPIAEMVMPGLRTQKKLKTGVLHEMNIAQLQVLVNDLHSQIENLNEELVQQLVMRDDLHMGQDSMLVDIEDLTRRFQEYASRVQANATIKDPFERTEKQQKHSTITGRIGRRK